MNWKMLVQKGDKERSSFQNVSGVILSINNTNERDAGKNTSKFSPEKVQLILRQNLNKLTGYKLEIRLPFILKNPIEQKMML